MNSDKIFLDARVTDVLGSHAFRAVLENGHPIIAFQAAPGSEASKPQPGGCVRVEFSPYDMSKGRICS